MIVAISKEDIRQLCTWSVGKAAAASDSAWLSQRHMHGMKDL